MTYQYNEGTNVRGMFGAIPKPERGYIAEFAKAGTKEERERIMAMVPDYVQPMLQKLWNGTSGDTPDGADVINSYEVPNETWSGWAGDVSSDDITVKMMDRSSLDAHVVGLGWRDQARKMSYKSGIPDSFTQEMRPRANIAGMISSAIQSAIPGIEVSAVSTNSPGVMITIS
jgi:hypothetical protein